MRNFSDLILIFTVQDISERDSSLSVVWPGRDCWFHLRRFVGCRGFLHDDSCCTSFHCIGSGQQCRRLTVAEAAELIDDDDDDAQSIQQVAPFVRLSFGMKRRRLNPQVQHTTSETALRPSLKRQNRNHRRFWHGIGWRNSRPRQGRLVCITAFGRQPVVDQQLSTMNTPQDTVAVATAAPSVYCTPPVTLLPRTRSRARLPRSQHVCYTVQEDTAQVFRYTASSTILPFILSHQVVADATDEADVMDSSSVAPSFEAPESASADSELPVDLDDNDAPTAFFNDDGVEDDNSDASSDSPQLSTTAQLPENPPHPSNATTNDNTTKDVMGGAMVVLLDVSSVPIAPHVHVRHSCRIALLRPVDYRGMC